MKSLERLGSAVANRPGTTIIVFSLLTALIIAGALWSVSSGRSEVRTDINGMFPRYEEVHILEEIQEDFGDIEPFMILVEANDVFEPDVFKRVAELERRLKEDKQIRKYIAGESESDKNASFYSLPGILAAYEPREKTGSPVTANATIAKGTSEFQSAAEIRALYNSYQNDRNVSATEKNLIRSFLPQDTEEQVSNDKSPRAMVMMVLLDGSFTSEELESVEVHINNNVVEGLSGDGVDFYSYAYGLLADSYSEAEKATEPLFMLAIALTFIISLINYRRLSDSLMSNLTVLLVVIWTFCAVGILGFDYSFMNMMVPILLVGLAIDFSFHGLIGYRERLDGEGTPEERVRGAAKGMIAFVGVAFFMATLSTASGFFANVSSALPLITEFGIVAALGIIFIFIFNLTFVPAVRVWLDLRRLRKGKPLTGVIPHQELSGSGGPIVGALSKTLTYPWPIVFVLAFILLAIPGFALVSSIKASYDPTGELLETQSITRAFKTINQDFSVGTESILVRIDGDLENPAVWQAIAASIDNASDDKYISVVDGVAGVEWIGAIMPAVGALDPAYARMDADRDGLPDTGTDPQTIRVTLDKLIEVFPSAKQYIHKGDSGYDSLLIRVAGKTNMGEHGLDARDDLKEDFWPVYNEMAKISYTGQPIIWNKGINEFSDSLISSTVLVIIFAGLLLVVTYGVISRSPFLGFLTIIPSITAVGWTLGVMVLADIPLNMMTAFVGSLTVGLGIDYPIHLVTRWADERRRGHSVLECYAISIRSTGKTVFFSALTTLSAFIAFSLMPMPVMKQFGIVMVIAITFCFLSAFLMMPLLIRFWHRKDDSPPEAEQLGV